MKTLFRLLILSILGWLALSACSPVNNLAAGGAAKDTGTTGRVVPLGEVKAPQIVGEEGGLYPPQDLSLVANTGRPQFLDSYADW
jgi:hypothetical protein